MGLSAVNFTAVRPLSSLGAGISETAQPYQQTATVISYRALSRAAQPKMFHAKKHRTCLYPHAVTMGPGLSRYPPPEGQRHLLLALSVARRRTYPTHCMVRASPYRSVKSVNYIAGYKIIRSARRAYARTPHTSGMAQCRAEQLWMSPSQLGPLRC